MDLRKWAVGFVLLTATVGSVASADSVQVDDPSEGWDIDVISAEHGHPDRHARRVITHDFEMDRTWTNRELSDFRLFLKLSEVPAPHRRVVDVLPNTDGSLTGRMWSPDGDFLGHVYAWRPTESVLRLEIARALLNGARQYRWKAFVHQVCDDTSGGEPSCVPQFDRVPDKGSILHRLGR